MDIDCHEEVIIASTNQTYARALAQPLQQAGWKTTSVVAQHFMHAILATLPLGVIIDARHDISTLRHVNSNRWQRVP